jgi:ABC-2 type transport system ATP-binding protein
VIRTEGLVKRYDGITALDGVSLRVPAGVVFGLVGPNGAGKTTLLSILAGLRSPTAGTVAIDADRSKIAVLPDTPRFDPWLTGREVVELAVELTAPGTGDHRARAALEEAGLAEAASRRVGGYSRGMLQRLGVAATVATGPDVMLLDEPASALDPVGRRDVLDLVRRSRREATVVFSSHILADVQEVSDHVGILDRGRLLYQGRSVDLLSDRAAPVYLIRLREGGEPAAEALGAQPWVIDVEIAGDRELRVRIGSLEEAERGLVGVLAGLGISVIAIRPESPTLEDVFLELMS